jgi:ABC-type spermidine/putrescine transport system permease subunit I
MEFSSFAEVKYNSFSIISVQASSPLLTSAGFGPAKIPIISPAIFFNLFYGIVGAFSSFLYMFLAPDTPGGPNYATYTMGLHIYNKAFVDGEMGYAAAMAWLLFLIVLAVVLVNYKLSGRWVFMASQDEGKA